MAERVQVNQDLGLNSPLRPTARPTDPYYRPAADTVQLEGGGSFADLAKSIGVITPVLQATLSEEDKRQQEEQIKAGAAARLKNQKNFKDAQNAGLIRPAENPWFVKGYMVQDGRLSGANYDEALRTAWASSDAKNSNNPADFQKFTGEFRAKWLEDNKGQTPDWMDGFRPKMEQADNNLQATHVAHRMKVIEDTLEANTGIEVSKILRDQKERELLAGNDEVMIDASRQAVAKELEALAADLVRKGLDGKKMNKILTDQVIAQAVETNDTSLLDPERGILRHVKTPGGSVADIADTREALNRAGAHVRSMIRQETQWQWALEDRPDAVEGRVWAKEVRAKQRETWDKQKVSEDRTERVRGYTSDIVTEINISGRIDPNKLRLLEKEDAGAAMTMVNYQQSRLQARGVIVSDQRAVANMELRIRTNPSSVSEQSIWSGVTSGTWSDGEARAMSNELQQRLNNPVRSVIDRDKDYQALNTAMYTSISQNLATARTGAGAAQAGLAVVEFRGLVEDIEADQKFTRGQKAAARSEAYLKTIEKYNKIAAQMMQQQDSAPTPKPGSQPTPGPSKFIPQQHVSELINNANNPEAIAEFDKLYGPGSSQKVLIGGHQGRYPITK